MATLIACHLFAVLLLLPGALISTNAQDLAFGQQTWQSSTLPGGDSSKAVDGNIKNAWSDGSCSHTSINSNDNSPWWAVDLGTTYKVGRIVFTTRSDCCPERNNNLLFGLTNTSPAVATPTVNTVTTCGRGPSSTTAGQKISVTCTADLARYVVVFSLQPYLTICELEVYEAETDLAFGQQTWQSSTLPGGESSKAADGNTKNAWSDGSCSHTSINSNDNSPWWAVDLGMMYKVGRVVLTTRSDCCPERNNNLIFGLTNTSPAVQIPTVSAVTICGRGPTSTTAGQKISFTCAAGVAPARYAVVLSPQASLTICELEVFGSAANPCAVNPCKNGGACSSVDSTTFKCSCISGWTGNDCGTDVNVCLQGNPCKNGGTCVKFGDSYECKCAATWAGTNCDMGSAACKAVLPENRINCGWSEVTQAQCNERSCCYDPMTSRPACFYAVDDCDALDFSLRADCGFAGISYSQCLGRGCCFDDDETTNPGPVCYKKVNPECLGVAAAKRVAQGNAGIQPNECAAQGWCWDSSAVPNCFIRA